MARCGLTCAIALFVSATAPQAGHAADTRTRLSGSWVANELRGGHRLVRQGATITGPLKLDNIDRVRRIFECHQCVFQGGISAHDVTFERTLDLSGSTFERDVDFSGATFHAPVLFRAALSEDQAPRKQSCRSTKGAGFKKRALFSLAVFNDLVSFGRTRFCAAADFRDARFADATFSGSRLRTAEFSRAAFRGVASFNDAHFADHASFKGADFRLRADFARAHFGNGGDFSTARFGGGASFLVADFAVKHGDEACSFQDAVSSGDLNFAFGTFENGIATFSDFVSSGALVLRDATFDPANGMSMNQLQVSDLVLDVAAVNGISQKADQIAVLRMVEESAKHRGDLTIANDAHFKLRELRSLDYNAFWGALDYIFYRGIAGYLVRPLRPLLALIALATLVALLRMRARREPTTTKPNPRPSLSRRLWQRTGQPCGTFLGCLLDTLAIAGPRWRSGDRVLALHERLEVVAYRLLLVCVLIGLANSNPTLRQMLDSLL